MSQSSIKIITWTLFQPDEVVVHKEYDAGNNDNDVALLLFDGKGFNITERVKPICLWNRDYNFEKIANKTAEVRLNFKRISYIF